jgi:hypothetical protein
MPKVLLDQPQLVAVVGQGAGEGVTHTQPAHA